MKYQFLLILFVIQLKLFSQVSVAQNDTIYFPPSLAAMLDNVAWLKIPNFSHTTYEPSPVGYEFKNNKSIKMVIECDGLLIDIQTARNDLKQHCLDKKGEGETVKIEEKRGLTVIDYPDVPQIKKNRKTYCEVIGIHPEGYKATISFEAPEGDKTLMDSLVDDFVNNAFMISPNYLDAKFGYPLKEVNKEALVEKRTQKIINKMKEGHPDYTPTEFAYDEINNDARRQVDKDIKWAYSYQKYYKTRKKVTLGKMPFSEWLDAHFLLTNNDDVEFLKAYGAGSHGELFDGFNTALAKHFGDTLVFNFIGDALEINSKGKIIFWSYTFPAFPLKDSTSLMVFCFVYDTTYRKWDSYKTVYPKFIARKDAANEIKILKHNIGEQEYDNITSDYIVFTNDSGNYFMGNNMLFNTNFIRVANVFDKPDNYKVVVKGVSFANNKLGYSEMSTPEGDNEVVGLKYITPDKRVYQSALQFDDLLGNNVNEAYLISVSNGKLLQIKVYTTTDKGVKEVLIDDNWKAKIKETDFFKKLSKESTATSSTFQK